MSTITSVLLAGVGGQGIILASAILARCAFSQGLMVKESELHGMAQRGGSVISHVRFGTEVHSPLIRKGGADFLVALEELEGLRYYFYAKPGAVVILNRKKIVPPTADQTVNPYPGDAESRLKASGLDVRALDALAIATEAGTPKAENVVLVGALSTFLPFPQGAWEDVIRQAVPPRTIDANMSAFLKGRGITKG